MHSDVHDFQLTNDYLLEKPAGLCHKTIPFAGIRAACLAAL